LLIRQNHFFRTGIERASVCGTFAFIFGLPSWEGRGLLVFAAAAALSGWRMRNTFFGVVAPSWSSPMRLQMGSRSAAGHGRRLRHGIGARSRCTAVWQRPSTSVFSPARAGDAGDRLIWPA